MKIHRLPDSLINRIAAGEVVERPASVLKELVENSLDAGATSVEVVLEGGGRERVRVRDDGAGMAEADVLLALERHATSKLSTAEDLFAIRTLGFRGEALPSIAEVSRFTLSSCEAGSQQGSCVEIEGGVPRPSRPASPVPGTDVDVRDLFFNVPARMKFLKTERTERSRCVEVMTRLALARPDVSFLLSEGSRTLLDARGTEELQERLAAVLGSDLRGRVLPFELHADGMEVFGLVSEPSLHRATSSGVHMFVNGRAVRDRAMIAAVRDGYQGVVPRGRHPILLAFLDVAEDRVDVNVHPAKTEVRFLDGASVFRILRRAIVECFRGQTALVAEPQARPQPTPRPDGPRWEASNLLPSGARPLWTPSAPRDLPPPKGPAGAAHREVSAAEWLPQDDRGDHPRKVALSELSYLGSFDHTFLLCQEGRDLVVLDQHAAHERVRFQTLLQQHEARGMVSQLLLLPQVLSLGVSRREALLDHTELLQDLGFEVDDFGGGEVSVKAVPSTLEPERTAGLLEAIADSLVADGRGRSPVEDMHYRSLALLACHSAVRAGDALSADEVRALFESLKETDFAFSCPHGRPFLVRFSRDEVARWFARD